MLRPVNRFNRLATLILLAGILLMGGCGTTRSNESEPIEHMFVLLLPFKNLTSTPNAGKAVSALFVSSITVNHAMYLTSADTETTKDLAKMAESGTLPENILEPLAKEHIDAVMFGNVTEYEYRSGLSTEPLVGFTWKMISTRTGRTIWAGTVSKLDSCFWVCHDTLTEFAKNLVDREVEKRLSEE
ncbi:MAG: hypothetical protein C75L2_00390021 [Leptospirillum sp. Group II 'C75']|jgi:hypothetical protein|uniref:Lipoprotein n=1 Tax=Leptospirillum sp. Group II '5-way CG' TaxID=419541 RepID=B6ARS9_9BACT|nr:hypothetical protein [Leptospirillum sp. Group II 'CF-1']AKS23088.1 hypothetical protein ABH19_03925 [Leptospirillum sp. Group II 'CF-1']EAY56912.1 MAG: protein of unknown function [Leptospirillum rubarum]EDZ38175.1 MAG: Protein of unknown function [Leptospirillum sp. Group II '5-way CG']EIJ75975.1 MAG: hypothetical protein C75L2_00390021 [Leptospirillum sp. Group II 'C75']